MSTTQPIRNLKQVEKLKNYYYKDKPNLRNYALICLGMNSALRISDLLMLRWQDVYQFNEKKFVSHVVITEQKTAKVTRIALNQSALHALKTYKSSIAMLSPTDFLFPGRTPDTHLSRSQAFRIIKDAGQNLHFETDISCHSLRKTFGYHAWKSGTPPVMLMAIYNHSSYHITKRYLGIDQDDKDAVFLHTNL